MEVVIVGAGAAGLAAGRALVDAGVEIAILEARDRLGGRIFTIRDPALPVPVELGAEFVHGSADLTRALVRSAGLTLCEAAGQRWLSSAGSLEPFDGYWEALDRIMRLLDEDRTPDRSFAAFLAARPGGRTLSRERRLAEQWIRGFHGASPELISERALADGGSPEGDESEQRQSRVLDGYGSVMSWLSHGFESAIHRSMPVTHIAWSDTAAEVTVKDGRRLSTRAVIVTVPVGVLQSSPAAEGNIQFDPPLPASRLKAIQQLAMSPIVRATFVLDEAFWMDRPPRGASGRSMAQLNFLHPSDGGMPICWTAHPVEAPMLVAWMGGPEAAAVAGTSMEAQQQHLLAGIAARFHVARRTLERRVRAVHLHDWINDPFSRGAYSYVTTGGINAGRLLARSPGSALHFAGEAIGHAGEGGTVESAIASGQRAAARLLKTIT